MNHHNVYVVLLDDAVAKKVKVMAANPKRDPKKPCVYVGITGLTPEERFKKHKEGYKSSKYVRDYGIKLLPKLYETYNPMSYDDAVLTEELLADKLRAEGYTVLGGH
ncbi:MAG: hypothetical protein JSV97_10830 [candidate division WOR-3 bacterium]|nr:MAG: hypothetical protein JSV97_10830 [candidate division WOR-3 bacterium]